MTPVEELHALYEQWRSLTEDEGHAIERGDWNHVSQCQSGKSRLQPRIVEVSRRLDLTEHERHFRPVVERLMELERRNRACLQNHQQAAETQKQALDRSSRHLRQLHQSYVPAARANWQWYS